MTSPSPSTDLSTVAGAPAGRLRPPSWRDPRLLAGLAVVLASTALGAWLVGAAGHTQPVYAADHQLLPGQSLQPSDVRVVQVRLGSVGSRYLRARSGLPAGAVVVDAVADGELVPVSALGAQEAVGSRPVALPVEAGSVLGLSRGSVVDIWVAARGAHDQTFEEPVDVARSARVAAVNEGGGVGQVGTLTGTATVRVLLPADLVPSVLSAVDNGARITLVAVPGSVSASGS